ncbi:MAG: hypothetical protein AMXMBFR44_5530 [Candidatus Campbellbacteria bacterium]
MFHIELSVDSAIADVAGHMAALAKQLKAPVTTRVWEVNLTVYPGDTKRQVKRTINRDLSTRCTR